MRGAHIVVVVLGIAVCGCLDPLVDDEVPPRGLVLPAGSTVDSAYDDSAVAQQIADNDGVDGEVPLLSGFVDGQPVHYWDFGSAPTIVAPIWVIVDSDGNPIDHNVVVDTIPGDSGYSPYWVVFTVKITDAYAGQIMPSIAAIREAEQLGLVEAPERQDKAVNCPTVAPDVALDVGTGTPEPASHWFYWQGRRVLYYDFGFIPLEQGVSVPDVPVYVLRREGSEPLSEPVRGVDITGDGDTNDTNNLFSYAAASDGYSPLCRTVDVAVPSAYSSIDTSGDESVAEFMNATDVFDSGPVAGNVVAIETTDTLWNCPQQTP